jgi:hypothetical protein
MKEIDQQNFFFGKIKNDLIFRKIFFYYFGQNTFYQDF